MGNLQNLFDIKLASSPRKGVHWQFSPIPCDILFESRYTTLKASLSPQYRRLIGALIK